jgi:hypothetical protein
MDPKVIRCEGVYWICLDSSRGLLDCDALEGQCFMHIEMTQDNTQWLTVVNRIMNLRVP